MRQSPPCCNCLKNMKPTSSRIIKFFVMFLTNLQVSVTYPLSLKIEDLEERTTMSNGKAIFFLHLKNYGIQRKYLKNEC